MNRHARLIKLGLDTKPAVADRLITDYTSSSFPNHLCSLAHGHKLFDQVPHRDTRLWTSLISAYTRSSQPLQALKLFSLMIRQTNPTLRPNHFVLATVARAIASSPVHLLLGRTIHAQAVKSGFLPTNVVLGTALLDMYSKCAMVGFARGLFDEMPELNVVTWNAMVYGYVHNGLEVHGLELFYYMKCVELCAPDEFTVATALTGCGWTRDVVLGMQVHGCTIVSGLDLLCVNPIGNMYFQCGQVCSAETILNEQEGNVVSKLIKIRGYVFNQRYRDVIDYVVSENKISGIFEVDSTMFVPLLTACAEMSLLKIGRQVHNLLIATGNSSEEDCAIIGSALINMYCKCNNVGEARKAFDAWPTAQVALWNSMISGYLYNGLVENARELWEEIPVKNVISWTSMISGYVQHCMPLEGLDLLGKMYSNGDGSRVEGNCFTFVVALEACSHITNLAKGKQIHAKLTRTLTKSDLDNVVVGTALVDMYSKSGHLTYAQTCFNLMAERNVVAWTSIIMGYAVHGLGFRALEIFEKMVEMGIEPNEVTFVCILTVCSHCGLVDEGLQYFKVMREKYGLTPREDHYTCLIDMLGRTGRLDEAWTLVDEIEDGETSFGYGSGSIWATMLGACQLHGNVEMGRIVAKKMLESKKQLSSTYVGLSNVYAAAGMWNEAYGVRENWKQEGNIDGDPGMSRICTSLP